jgi:outer membrane murein-binding lipoprotein Lpp
MPCDEHFFYINREYCVEFERLNILFRICQEDVMSATIFYDSYAYNFGRVLGQNMLRGFTITAAIFGSLALAGCAGNYPRLPNLTRMDNLLTQKERDARIKNLTNDSQSAKEAPASSLPEGEK